MSEAALAVARSGPPARPAPLRAFAGIGIEMEFMIVDAHSLDVRPLADRVLRTDGRVVNELPRGALGWSNELALHVLEVKNRDPRMRLDALGPAFRRELDALTRTLAPLGAQLMPGAMHPWMDPLREMRLWPHDNQAIYQAYDRIFDCRGHGWANLQSMHVNLPFSGDEEFARLHAAVRLVLPMLPALAAASPIADGACTGWADYRMHVYDDNARGFPSIAGKLVPESVASRAAYEADILQPMYRAIAAQDPDGLLQHEWLNSRGAIARFDRDAIEIRVIDTQESVSANLAVAAATVAAVKMLFHTNTLAAQQALPTDTLAAILQACMRDGEQAEIDNADYLALLGLPSQGTTITTSTTASDVWRALLERMLAHDTLVHEHRHVLRTIIEQGPLARRILRALDVEGTYSVATTVSRTKLEAVYRRLCDCLREDRLFGTGT